MANAQVAGPVGRSLKSGIRTMPKLVQVGVLPSNPETVCAANAERCGTLATGCHAGVNAGGGSEITAAASLL